MDWLLQSPKRGPAVADHMEAAGSLHTVDMAPVEVVSGLRRKLRRKELAAARASEAVTDLADTRLRYHSAALLTHRIWELRDSHSAYDAAYVALAEALAAPLVTTDARLARTRGHRAEIVGVS